MTDETTGNVTGYQPIAVDYTDQNWNGLEGSGASQDHPLIDGTTGNFYWYAIGTPTAFAETGIPGPGIVVQTTELYACLSSSPTATRTASPTLAPTFVSPDAPCEDDPMYILQGDTTARCDDIVATKGCDFVYGVDSDSGYGYHQGRGYISNRRFARPVRAGDTCGLTATVNASFAVRGWRHIDDHAGAYSGCHLVQGGEGAEWQSGPNSEDGDDDEEEDGDSEAPQAYRLVGACGGVDPAHLGGGMYGGIEQDVTLDPGRQYRVTWTMSTGPFFTGQRENYQSSYTLGTVRLSVVGRAANGTTVALITNVTNATSSNIEVGDWDSFEAVFEVSSRGPTTYTVKFDVGWSGDPNHNGCVNIAEVELAEVWSGWNTSVAALCPAHCGACNSTLNDMGLWVPPTCASQEARCAEHPAGVPGACATRSGECGGDDGTEQTECDAESYCGTHGECRLLSGLDLWAECNTTADCDGRTWCWYSPPEAVTGVCKPSGLCRGQPAPPRNPGDDLAVPNSQGLLNAARMVNLDPNSAAAIAVQADFNALNFALVDPVIDLAIRQNATISIRTARYAISVFTVDSSDDMFVAWSPPAESDPTDGASCTIAELGDSDGCAGGCRLARAFYSDPAADLTETLMAQPNFEVASGVFSLWLVPTDSEDAVEYVGLASVNFTLDMANATAAGDYLCAQYSTRGWTSEGCAQQANGSLVQCQCESTTRRARRGIGGDASYFTVLVGGSVGGSSDDGAPSAAEAASATALIWVTYIGLAFSVPFMLAFAFLYARYEELRNQHRFNVANLCGALAVSMLLFVFGINGESGTAGCAATAFLLQWTLLVAVSWMLLDGLFLYRTFVQVFRAHRSAPNLGRKATAAYLIPLALCTFSFAVWGNDYGFTVATAGGAENSTLTATNAVCFINQESDARFVFFVPLVAMLMINLIFFVAVMHVVVSAPLAQSAKKKLVPPRTKRALKASLMFLPTMGLSWGFGIAAAELDDADARLVFTWLFTVLSVAQGVIIFWFHLYQDGEVRRKVGLFQYFSVRTRPKVYRQRRNQEWFAKQTPAGMSGAPLVAASTEGGSSTGTSLGWRVSGVSPPAYTEAPLFERSSTADSDIPDLFCRANSNLLPTVETEFPVVLWQDKRAIGLGGTGDSTDTMARSSKGGEYIPSSRLAKDAGKEMLWRRSADLETLDRPPVVLGSASPRDSTATVWAANEPDTAKVQPLSLGHSTHAAEDRSTPGLRTRSVPPTALDAAVADEERSRKATLWDGFISRQPAGKSGDGLADGSAPMAAFATLPLRRKSLV